MHGISHLFEFIIKFKDELNILKGLNIVLFQTLTIKRILQRTENLNRKRLQVSILLKSSKIIYRDVSHPHAQTLARQFKTKDAGFVYESFRNESSNLGIFFMKRIHESNL
jgi:hypothetical protein